MRRLAWEDLAGGAARTADGEVVEIDGFLCPTEPEQSHAYFVLGPDLPCCLGCLPRDPLRAVEVFAAAPVSATGRKLRLRGELVCLDDDPAGWCYQLRGAQAEPAPPRAAPFPRRALLASLGPLACAAVAAPVARAAEADGRAALADAVGVDMHSHAGGLAGLKRVEENRPFTAVAGPMREGGMAVACLSIVSDAPVHRVMDDHRIHPFRDPAPGELSAYGERCFAHLHALIGEQSLSIVTTAAELHAARATAPGAIVAAEGADFLEGDLARLDHAYEHWKLRHLQLTHYRANELGDIQTEAPVHNGLSAFGAEVIRHCNRRGIVVDVAHGTFDLVRRAAQVTAKPLVLSHTSLTATPPPRSRLISPEHAQLVARTGGVVGVWPPASRFPTLEALALGMRAMAEVVGVDHVGLGSDMMGLTGPAIYSSYAETPALAAALLSVGFGAEDVRKILGGNYLRVFTATLA